MMYRITAFLVVALTLALGAPVVAGKVGASYQVIVHPGNPVREIDKSFLRDAFLKRALLWPNDTTIRPVDLSKDFAVREQFSRDVLNRSVAEVRNYWHQQIFSGKGVPPAEMESEAAVIAFVLRNPGAVGYLSADTSPGGAKVVTVK